MWRFVNSDGMILDVGVGYLLDSWVASWFSQWFLGLPLDGFVITSNEKLKA